LQVGDYILPPSETGVMGMSDLNRLFRRDRVYVTPNIVDARFYASAAADLERLALPHYPKPVRIIFLGFKVGYPRTGLMPHPARARSTAK
jgi:hypothetical protein